ncbi:glycosyltransferase family 4 protein [Halosimplex sp. TS25]|uniref:glycosyltransferase family 4 protein n=1 Tax=Halosimplex rarum TaxID=3396619 RepID=UPI0039EA9CC4
MTDPSSYAENVSESLNILFMPRSNENPYQSSLMESLGESGHTVWVGGGNPINFARGISENGIPDVIHVHWLATYLIGDSWITTLLKSITFGVCALFVKLIGIKLVWTVHNLAEHERRHPRWERFVKSLYSGYIFDRLIVHCSSAVELVKDTFGCEGDKIDVVPHANYIGLYPDSISEERARAELGIDQDKTLFLHFGQIRDYKRVPWLMEYFNRTCDEDALLLVAGNARTEELEKAVTDRQRNCERIYTELRFIPEEEVQYYFRAADAMILGFDKVLTSGSAVLAMSFGLPIVSPRLGCLPDMIAEDGGFFYKNDDPDELVQAIERALDCELNDAGTANFQRAKHFTWDQMASLTVESYLHPFE